MKKILSPIILCALFYNSFAQTSIYPAANKVPVTETFYNKYTVTDNYRWMENLDNPELKKWVTDENNMANKFVMGASNRNNAAMLIEQLSDGVTYHNPVKKGKYYFTHSYYDEVGAAAIFIQNRMDGEARLLVDPNFISQKDKIAIKGYEVSADSKYLAYQYSRNGSDRREINVTEIEGAPLKDHLTHVKFSDIEWHGNGFYYSAYPTESALGKTEGQVVYYHKLNTLQSDDEVVFKRTDPSTRFDFLTTADGRYFVLEEHNKTKGLYNYFYIDYNDTEPVLKPLLLNMDFGVDILGSHDGKFVARNIHNADNGSIVEIDPKNPTKWNNIAPSYAKAILTQVLLLKDKVLAVYTSNLHPSIVVTDYKGNILQSISFPLGTSIGSLNGEPGDEEVLFSYQSYTTPPIVYRLNTTTYKRSLTKPSAVNFDYDSFEYKESKYAVNDSVKVPMLLIYRKGIKLDGNNPTLLETYGGFGAVNAPCFNPGLVYFLNKGGVYAYAYVRGEGELGTKWANAGRGKYKQNSFSDFIAGAEFLINQGYTKPAKLAITGGSNGGLVVAAAAIQRPDLFKAVIPEVAPFDMLRFENFTIGALHKSEYGTVTDSTSFTRLYNYSPYNNIKSDVNYPAMLVITSDNDDRVPPFHSYKFVAEMQSRPAQINAIYLMSLKKSGHNGAGSNGYLEGISEQAKMYAFVVEMLKK